MNRNKPAVYIVDDDQDFRESLTVLVVMLGYQVYAFSSAEAFLECTQIRRPACLLLDVFLPNIDGFQVQKRLQERGMLMPVIFITGHGDVPMGVKAMKDGAVDFLLKPFDKKDLHRAIVLAHDRDADLVRKEELRKNVSFRIALLTPREREVMLQVVTGKLNKQIASTLGIAEKTVRIHRSSLMRKLEVFSVAALIKMLADTDAGHFSSD